LAAHFHEERLRLGLRAFVVLNRLGLKLGYAL
jgi:hypothetical protein